MPTTDAEALADAQEAAGLIAGALAYKEANDTAHAALWTRIHRRLALLVTEAEEILGSPGSIHADDGTPKT